MSISINISEEKNQLLKLAEKLDNEPVIINAQGSPIMVAMSYDKYLSLLETIDILSDEEFKEQLMLGIKEDKDDKRVSFDEAMKQLKW